MSVKVKEVYLLEIGVYKRGAKFVAVFSSYGSAKEDLVKYPIAKARGIRNRGF